MTIKLDAAIWAGIAAGILSSLAQVTVWILFTDRFPGALFRDARLTAAIVLGHHVLPPPATFDITVMLAAGIIHFALSLIYGITLALALARWHRRHGAVIGAAFGLALYLINLYGFTTLFPWFTRVRDANTFMAHIVFGVTAAAVYRALVRRSGTGEATGR